MSFEMWLFAIKKFAQSYDMALAIYEQLSEGEKMRLKDEYQDYIRGNQ